MPEETTATGDGGETKSDSFDPESLSPEAQEHIRVEIQKQSDTKAANAVSAEMVKVRAEQAQSSRTAVETAERNELRQLATSGQNEALGVRVAAMMQDQDARSTAVTDASNAIERQMADAFTEKLGPDRVEQIRQETVKKVNQPGYVGGAHAEFALGLAAAADSDARAKQITEEVQAALTEAGVAKRDVAGGGSDGAKGQQGNPPKGFDEIQKAYTAGTLGPTPERNRELYKEALEARGK